MPFFGVCRAFLFVRNGTTYFFAATSTYPKKLQVPLAHPCGLRYTIYGIKKNYLLRGLRYWRSSRFLFAWISQSRRAPALQAACRQPAGYTPETQQRGSGVDAGAGQCLFRTENEKCCRLDNR